jgi:hypothetical protein
MISSLALSPEHAELVVLQYDLVFLLLSLAVDHTRSKSVLLTEMCLER